MEANTSVIGTLQYIYPREGINLDYLYYSLLTIDFKKYVAGAAIPHIYFKDYKNEPFLYVPLPEQKRIVSILDKCFTAIDKAKANTEQNLKNAKELFESYLQGVFENGKDWEMRRLGEICEFVRGPFGGSLKKNIFKSEGYAVYEQQHAIYDQFDEVRYFIDENKFEEMKRFRLKAGDLIMSCSGTIGKAAIVPKNFKKGIINQALLKISPNNNLLNIFLKLYMQSKMFQDRLKNYSGGAAIQNVASVATLKNIEIPLPPLQTQQSIVNQLDSLKAQTQKLETVYNKKISDLAELKKSILQEAFRGKLTEKGVAL